MNEMLDGVSCALSSIRQNYEREFDERIGEIVQHDIEDDVGGVL